MGKCTEASYAMIVSHTAVADTTETQMVICKMHQRIIHRTTTKAQRVDDFILNVFIISK